MDHELREAYSAEGFRQLGHRLVDTLADHLAQAQTGEGMRANPWQTPEERLAHWRADLAADEKGDPIGFFEEVLGGSVHLHHPKYLGHQISPPLPVAALAGLMSDLLNNGMAVYEMGAAATAMERVVIETVSAAMGFGEGAGGYLTSGGTLANLTALLAARSVKAPENVWEKGDTARYALMVCEEAHYCVDRAARIMGWGAAGIIKVPADERFRMRTELLPAYLEAARAEGIQVLAVVGSACSTATGAFDDLAAIADFCAAQDLWFHVDGAHGGALALSGKYRHVVEGISRADSVAMDFHKMLLSPSITTALIFREERMSFQTFAQKAQYLFAESSELEWHNVGRRTFECTKLMMSLKVYAILRTHGLGLWQTYIEQVNDLVAEFGRMVAARPDFELATVPECNIACFRYAPAGQAREGLSALNAGIRKALLEHSDFYIVQTTIRGEVWLRITLTNPFTTEHTLAELLDACAAEGASRLAPGAGALSERHA